MKNRRLLIKPYFQDKDRNRSGFIAFTRFKSIFDNFRMQVSDQEYGIILKRFMAKAANEINYVEFDHVLRHYSGDHHPFWASETRKASNYPLATLQDEFDFAHYYWTAFIYAYPSW